MWLTTSTSDCQHFHVIALIFPYTAFSLAWLYMIYSFICFMCLLQFLEYLICREQVSFVTQCHPLSHCLLFYRDFIFFLFLFCLKKEKEMITFPLVASFSYPWPHGKLCIMITRKHSKWYDAVITFSIDMIERSSCCL